MKKSTNIRLEELTDDNLRQLFGIIIESGIPLSKPYAKRYIDANSMRKELALRDANPYEVRVNPIDQNKILFFNKDGCLSVDYIASQGYEEADKKYQEAFDKTFPKKD